MLSKTTYWQTVCIYLWPSSNLLSFSPVYLTTYNTFVMLSGILCLPLFAPANFVVLTQVFCILTLNYRYASPHSRVYASHTLETVHLFSFMQKFTYHKRTLWLIRSEHPRFYWSHDYVNHCFGTNFVIFRCRFVVRNVLSAWPVHVIYSLPFYFSLSDARYCVVHNLNTRISSAMKSEIWMR